MALGSGTKSVPDWPPDSPHALVLAKRSFQVASPAVAVEPKPDSKVLSVLSPSPQSRSARRRTKSISTLAGPILGTRSIKVAEVTIALEGRLPAMSNLNRPRAREPPAPGPVTPAGADGIPPKLLAGLN